MRKNILLATTAALFALGAANTAHAVPAYGYAEIEFTNFTLTGIVDSSGTPLTGVTNFTSAVNLTDQANYPLPPLSSANTAPAGNLVTGADVAQAKAGPGPFPAENVFTQQLTGASGTRGDGLITGALAGGATSNLVSEGRLTPFGTTAGSQAGSTTTLQATFGTTAGLTVDLFFNAAASMAASVGATGDSANEQVSASFKIHDITTNTDVSIADLVNGGSSTVVAPAALNDTIATTQPSFSPTFSSTLTGQHYEATLAANNEYQITLSDSTTTILSTAAAVPEPVSAALLGTGLIVLGVVRRRRNR